MSNKIVIIGGGAAGVVCAIAAKRADKNADVLIVEKNGRILKKLLSTGNGRCNYTNVNADISHYYGEEPSFADDALKEFGADLTVKFFKTLGILPKEEENGKIFPMSLQAASVVDMLRFEAERLGVSIKTETDVKKVEKISERFVITCQNDTAIEADAVVIATGGCASSGATNNYGGYNILKDLGHLSTKLTPALVQFRTEKSFVFGLQGTKLEACVTVKSGGKIIGEATDELLFTEYGLSGSVIFSLSKYCHFYDSLTACIDFFPSVSMKSLAEIMESRQKELGHLTMESFFNGLIHKKVGQAVAKLSGIENLSVSVSEITAAQIQKLVEAFKKTELKIIGTTGFKNAQVTAGGVMTKDFDSKTMESKLVKNLYAVGEVLDIFGDCGGYNLQWAWSSGYVAGINAAKA